MLSFILPFNILIDIKYIVSLGVIPNLEIALLYFISLFKEFDNNSKILKESLADPLASLANSFIDSSSIFMFSESQTFFTRSSILVEFKFVKLISLMM